LREEAHSGMDRGAEGLPGPMWRFQGSSMREACRKMQEALGDDAVVIHTRSFKKGGLILGIGAREVFEITASKDTRVPDYRAASDVNRRRAAGMEYVARTRPKVVPMTRPGADRATSEVLNSELAEIKGMLLDLMRRSRTKGLPAVSDELVELFIQLVESGVHEEVARRLVKRVNTELSGDALHDREALRIKLVEGLAQMMPTGGILRLKPGKCTVICLIGPTGVGKTTTLAKLAASYSLGQGKRVGIITADTYRIAAVEQLQRYADLMGVPLRTVLTPTEARRSVEEFADFDLVLVDTAGRSQRDEMKMNELHAYLDALKPDETHLVLAATSRGRTLEGAATAFGRLGVDRLIITKLDEAEEFGFLPQLAIKVSRNLSYITNGQRVPEDIVEADSVALAELVLRREAA